MGKKFQVGDRVVVKGKYRTGERGTIIDAKADYLPQNPRPIYDYQARFSGGVAWFYTKELNRVVPDMEPTEEGE